MSARLRCTGGRAEYWSQRFCTRFTLMTSAWTTDAVSQRSFQSGYCPATDSKYRSAWSESEGSFDASNLLKKTFPSAIGITKMFGLPASSGFEIRCSVTCDQSVAPYVWSRMSMTFHSAFLSASCFPSKSTDSAKATDPSCANKRAPEIETVWRRERSECLLFMHRTSPPAQMRYFWEYGRNGEGARGIDVPAERATGLPDLPGKRGVRRRDGEGLEDPKGSLLSALCRR